MIKNLDEFYSALNGLDSPLESYCKSCKRHCCRGYIMLMTKEAINLVKNGVSVLKYNSKDSSEKGYMLDTFPRDESGKIKQGVIGPECPNRDAGGKCSAYAYRPLVCRLYPIDLQEVKNRSDIFWVVHKKCDFISEAVKEDVDAWLSKAENIVNSIDEDFMSRIAVEWRKLVCDMVFPPDFDGYDVHILKPAFPIYGN